MLHVFHCVEVVISKEQRHPVIVLICRKANVGESFFYFLINVLTRWMIRGRCCPMTLCFSSSSSSKYILFLPQNRRLRHELFFLRPFLCFIFRNMFEHVVMTFASRPLASTIHSLLRRQELCHELPPVVCSELSLLLLVLLTPHYCRRGCSSISRHRRGCRGFKLCENSLGGSGGRRRGRGCGCGAAPTVAPAAAACAAGDAIDNASHMHFLLVEL
mmetsp:Transcript_102/g.176  ORF Transcript_102/g.176 Transcript_102/m.176 type:complete len:216 (+) Transcript_102:177-824(+)